MPPSLLFPGPDPLPRISILGQYALALRPGHPPFRSSLRLSYWARCWPTSHPGPRPCGVLGSRPALGDIPEPAMSRLLPTAAGHRACPGLQSVPVSSPASVQTLGLARAPWKESLKPEGAPYLILKITTPDHLTPASLSGLRQTGWNLPLCRPQACASQPTLP